MFDIYGGTPESNALIRTTTVPTMIAGGTKENIIPYMAKAYINFRMLPGTSVADVKERVTKMIDDERITISISSTPNEPSEVSGITSFGYQMISRTIKEVFPQVVTSPNLVIGATDARHYYSRK
ncbi:MAG: peptidase dimerization domain-containing protein [Bacteroidota bacterium]